MVHVLRLGIAAHVLELAQISPRWWAIVGDIFTETDDNIATSPHRLIARALMRIAVFMSVSSSDCRA